MREEFRLEDDEEVKEYPLLSVTDEELEDYIDWALFKMWGILCECQGGHPYFWPVHNLYQHIEESTEHGIREFIDDVFDGEADGFVPWFEETIAGMELLLRAGKGLAVPRVCEKPIVDYLRRSNRPRHLTEMLGMLAEEHGIYLDRARLGSHLSNWQKVGLVKNRMCPVIGGRTLERGYWWAEDESDLCQLSFSW